MSGNSGQPSEQPQQRIPRSKKTCEYSTRQKDFIQESFNPQELARLPNGTHVVYVAPEGSDRHLSMISLDSSGGPSKGSSSTKKAKIKKLGQKLYPRKAIGGVKAVGGAIRHPMVTTRKVNSLVRKKGKGVQGALEEEGEDITEESPDEWPLPLLTRSQTITELNTMVENTEEGIPLFQAQS
jgi:hypothetical protein